MKKLILWSGILLFPWIANAQDFGMWNSFHQGHRKRPDIVTLIGRKIQQTRYAHEKLPWAKQVEKQLFKAQPHGLVGLKLDVVYPLPQPPVSPQLAWTYQKRMQAVQNAINGNQLLKRFKVSTPRPEDLVLLNDHQFQHLLQFLNNPITVQKADKRYVPTSVQTYQRYLVRVTLQIPEEKTNVNLIFNCYSREMYVAYNSLNLPNVPLNRLETASNLSH